MIVAVLIAHVPGHANRTLSAREADSRQNRELLQSAGGVDYVTKPFDTAELVARVKTQLALRNACTSPSPSSKRP